MTYKIAYDNSYEKVADVAQAEAVLDHIATLYGPGGHRCIVHVAPGDSDDPWTDAMLRVGVDPDVDRGFVSWHGGRAEYGYEPEIAPLTHELVFDDNPDEPPVEMLPAHTRVTAAIVRRAVREYVITGNRPTCVWWPFDTTDVGADEGPDGGRAIDGDWAGPAARRGRPGPARS
jgi:hypothetical protein